MIFILASNGFEFRHCRITDAVNASGELYSEERLKTDLGTLDEAAPHEVIDKVLRKVKAFAGDSPQFDDITMLAVRWDAS